MPQNPPSPHPQGAARPSAAAQAAALPIWQQVDEIVAAIANHRVVVVEGPAGCGKTTQLPRMLLQAGLVPRRMGITQPRRIAAIGVAGRIAEEEDVALGAEVGYAIRFDDKTSAQTRIKVMTDGILLQEARTDAKLSAYDVLLVDEAHERSLNIDFTMGLLHRTLQRRPDLKVVISSATLHPGAFQRYFGEVAGKVAVVKVPSRLHPLKINYAPIEGGASPQNIVDDATDHVLDLLARTSGGHILAFLPGEGLINRTAQQLAAQRLMGVQVLPLYGRLPQHEQQMVFADTLPVRKVILATNIAETSITIDKVVAVIDCGLHKLPWYNARTGVTSLREEPISLASAAQRAGRAGRTGPGQVIRMYSEASMGERPEFTREEILRIDLSEAVLRLIDLGIHDVEDFAFPTPPPRGKLLAALETLHTLGAITKRRELTEVGRRMVPYPLSPALARMVVEACSRFPDALDDVLLTGALLSVRSPFTYPQGQEEAAQAAQAKMRHELGDVITTLGAFHRWRQAPDKASFCKKWFLEPDTMAFVDRAHHQLRDIAHKLGNEVREVRAAPGDVLRCLATGFADRLLARTGFAYETLQGLRVAVHPSSALYGSKAPFAVAAELMESGRTYAFQVSALDPAWVSEVSPEAVRVWRLRAPKTAAAATQAATSAAGAATPEPAPQHVVLGGRRFALKGRRRPKLEIALQDVAALIASGPHRLDPEQQKVQAKVISPFGVVVAGSLAEVLALLPELPLATADVDGAPPPAAIVDWDRSLHVVERHLDRLLILLAGPKAVQPGWVALLANGHGGVWFELMVDYVDALVLSHRTLDAMLQADDLAASDALRGRLQTAHTALGQKVATLHAMPVLRRRLANVL